MVREEHSPWDTVPFLYVLPFILPTVFTATLFAFQNNRRDSDFYHSLPVTRSTLHLSLLAAVATWCGIVVVGSSLVVFPLGILANGPLVSNGLLAVTGATVSCLFVMSVVFLGYTLSGNTMSALFASAVLLTVLCLWLGLIVGARRPSETAGRPNITPKLQHLFRLLAAFTVCLMPITELYEVFTGGAALRGYNASSILSWYLSALAVYFLFELITTRKVKNLVKAIPWLGVLAAMNVVCLLGMHVTTVTLNAIDKQISGEVEWVQLVEPLDYWSYEKQASGGVDTRNRPHKDSVDPFAEFAEAYVGSDCDDVQPDSTKARDIAKTALERAIRYRDLEDEGEVVLHNVARNAQTSEGYIYEVELRIKIGLFPRNRVVYLYDDEMESLLKHIDAQTPVPRMEYLYWIEE